MTQPTPRPNNSAAHTALVAQIRLALGQDPDVVGWPFQPGGVHDSTGKPMRCGPVGLTDLVYIVRMQVRLAERYIMIGRFCGLEVKTGAGRLSAEQRMFHNLVRRFGGFASEVRSVDDAKAAICRCKMGLDS